MNTFGERLKTIRGTMTQVDFAKSLGVTQRAIVNYEKLNRIPRGNIIRKICENYGINEIWLLTGEGNKFICDSENMRHVAGYSENKKAQPIENGEKPPNKICDTSHILKIQQELVEAIKEQNRLIRENSNLQIQLKERDQRIKELEKEIERLRGEPSLAKSRAAGVQAG